MAAAVAVVAAVVAAVVVDVHEHEQLTSLCWNEAAAGVLFSDADADVADAADAADADVAAVAESVLDPYVVVVVLLIVVLVAAVVVRRHRKTYKVNNAEMKNHLLNNHLMLDSLQSPICGPTVAAHMVDNTSFAHHEKLSTNTEYNNIDKDNTNYYSES